MIGERSRHGEAEGKGTDYMQRSGTRDKGDKGVKSRGKGTSQGTT
jgi:hypothetical protein